MNLGRLYCRLVGWTSILTVLAIVVGCSTVPISGRRQINFIPDSQMLSMSQQQYSQFLRTHKKSGNANQTAAVKRVGGRIANAVERYMRQYNMTDQLADYKWEFNLIESKEANAWAMPGGKVVVYTGILPITRDDTGLAVVLSHEIAHVVAEHGNERMSQATLTQLGGMALSEALEQRPTATRQLWMAAFGAGAQYGLFLPFSRLQETEADRLGLTFMAVAGYDPRQAVTFWERMANQKSGRIPEFLSTHPSDETRIDRIKDALPEALQYYRPRRA